jgi:hypothetical protein
VTAQHPHWLRPSPLALSADQPDYGHPARQVQNKADFVDGAVKSHWKSIVASDETASIVGNIASARSTVVGESESDG